MREIKFRGKRIATGKWVYGGIAEYDDHIFIMENGYNTVVYPATVGQYVGLKDRNGKEIYEGDIVEITSYFTQPRDKVMARFNVEIVFHKNAFVGNHASGIYHIENFFEDVKVIGNIHDNPELLKKGGEE